MRQSKPKSAKKSPASKRSAPKKASAAAKKSTARKAAPAKTAKPKAAKPKTAARVKSATKPTETAAKPKIARTKVQRSDQPTATMGQPPTVVIAQSNPATGRSPDVQSSAETEIPDRARYVAESYIFEPTALPSSARGGTIISAPAQGEAENDDADSGKSAGVTARINRLVPTNAVHPTARRQRRQLYQSRPFMLTAAAVVIGILIWNDQGTPPDVSPLEQRASNPAAETSAWIPSTIEEQAARRITDPVQAMTLRERNSASDSGDWTDKESFTTYSPEASSPVRTAIPFELSELSADELTEMEQILGQLDLNPSRPDGLVDLQTKTAIRLYQQIAGLPINGEPSQDLLHDLREVAKLLDSGN